jgi:hypothetical protein
MSGLPYISFAGIYFSRKLIPIFLRLIQFVSQNRCQVYLSTTSGLGIAFLHLGDDRDIARVRCKGNHEEYIP